MKKWRKFACIGLLAVFAFALANCPSPTSPGGGGATSTPGTPNNTPDIPTNMPDTPNIIHVTGVSLNKPSTSIEVDAIETLTATITPSNATNQSVTWTSSNASVATVSEGGVIVGVSPGKATITVTTVDGNKTAACTVTVNSIPVTGVSLNKTSTYLVAGGTETLFASIEPHNATNKNVTWSSSNTAAATVSPDGVVTAVAAGTAVITVTTADGAKTASCIVTVSTYAVSVTGVTLNKSTTSIVFSSTEILTATITPYNATYQAVTWSSSNPAVAVVSAGGEVTAKNVGSATITVTTADGNKTASCGVTVNPKAITLTVDPISATQTYTGSAHTPAVTVRDGATVLTLNTDYTVAYTNNTNAGTATVTITGKSNYAGSSSSRTFTINKAAGAAVSAPTGTSSVTGNSITINAVTAPGNGQTVEYARNTTNSAPSSGWQDGMTFSGLATGTTYYIFARSKENANYYAGTPSAGLQVTISRIDMVRVPGGSFQMGNPGPSISSLDYEKPVHTVTLTEFYMGKYEVTQAQWQAVMGKTMKEWIDYVMTFEDMDGGIHLPEMWVYDLGIGDNYPVYFVPWYFAVVFCNKLSIMEGLTPVYSISGKTNPSDWDPAFASTQKTVSFNMTANGYRLPTEAEWEYAARGGNGSPGNYKFSGSNTLDEVAWYFGNSGYRTHEVGKKKPNDLGIYDMTGNVLEWCWDLWWNYSSGPVTNPTGVSNDYYTFRVKRGGYYFGGQWDPYEDMFSMYRWGDWNSDNNELNSDFNGHHGFRVVRRP